VLSSSIFGLAMSGGVAAAATDTKNVLEVVAIAEVDFGGILGTRSGAVAVGMTSDCKVLFTAQDALQFASGGASETAAKQKLAAMVKADGSPEGFHRGRWKQVGGWRRRLRRVERLLVHPQGLCEDASAVGPEIGRCGRARGTVAADESACAGARHTASPPPNPNPLECCCI